MVWTGCNVEHQCWCNIVAPLPHYCCLITMVGTNIHMMLCQHCHSFVVKQDFNLAINIGEIPTLVRCPYNVVPILWQCSHGIDQKSMLAPTFVQRGCNIVAMLPQCYNLDGIQYQYSIHTMLYQRCGNSQISMLGTGSGTLLLQHCCNFVILVGTKCSYVIHTTSTGSRVSTARNLI